jgi:hypothetical protein
MKSNVWQDRNNWTHIDWELDGVTAKMLDWFWSNMEKGDSLWHPDQHMDFGWFLSPEEAGGPIGSIHIAPQKWSDGKMLKIYIRMEDFERVPAAMREVIKYDHCVIVSGISLTGIKVQRDDPAFGYRIHQWQKSDAGVIGMSSGIEVARNEADNGLIWAKHATEEVSNWEIFLPRLYELYKVIKNPRISRYYSFKVEGKGEAARYTDLKVGGDRTKSE